MKLSELKECFKNATNKDRLSHQRKEHKAILKSIKTEFNKLVWPDSQFVAQTSLTVGLMLLTLGAVLTFLLDPIAMYFVMTVKQG